jgi:F-type H+-transporting ATPase subunit delta
MRRSDVGSKKDGGEETALRYAQAGLELAIEAKADAALDQDFNLLDAALAESADLREALASPLIGPEAKSKALVAVAAKIGISPLGQNLIGVVAKNGRAALLPLIGKEYRKLLDARRGTRLAEIISAAPLESEDLAAILNGLGGQGSGVRADVKVDESLIGGFIVRIGSRQFDASLRTKLNSLKLALKA